MSLQLFKCYKNFSRLSLNNSNVVVTSIRNHWNKDYKPGPYPETEAERLIAAKKYDLLPSEYIPYNDDGTGHGDYPKFKAESGDSRDPHYPWDFPEFKRNFNEPLHVEFDLIREDRYDVNAKHRISCWMQFVQFFSVMAGAYLLAYLAEHVKCFHAAIPKQFPEDGKKHYKFE